MHWQYIPYVAPFLVSALITATLAVYARKRVAMPGARAFSITMLLISFWSCANIAETISTDLPTILFWENLQYIGYLGVPITWLIMTANYTGRGQRLIKRYWPALLIIPTITVLLIAAGDWHGLLRSNVSLDTAGPITRLTTTYGPWLWAQSAYSYMLLLANIMLLLWTVITTLPVFRRQPLTLLIGTLIPLTWNTIYVSDFNLITTIDLTPFVLGLTSFIIAWALFQQHLFDIVPVAHDKVVEGMSDGVIVLDGRGHVVELNPAAESIFGLRSSIVLGQQYGRVFARWPQMNGILDDSDTERTELGIDCGDERRYYEVQISLLTDSDHSIVGKVVVLRDITERRQQVEELTYLAGHDPLTCLPNRLSFENALKLAVARARRGHASALLYFDADNFKVINDTLGHGAGDKALIALAGLLRHQLREVDMIARLGGDEFGALLVDINREQTWHIAERMCQAVEEYSFSQAGYEFKLSLSIGIVFIDGAHTYTEVLAQADTAMYNAKSLGRNCIDVFVDSGCAAKSR